MGEGKTVDKFDKPFQDRVMRGVVSDPHLFSVTSAYLKSDLFDDPRDPIVFETVKEIYERLGAHPPVQVLLRELRKADPDGRAIERWRELRKTPKVSTVEATYIIEEVAKFAKRQNWKNKFGTLVDLLKKADVDEFEKALHQELMYATISDDDPWRYLTDIKRRFTSARSKMRPIRTLIPELDDILFMGGLLPTELGVVVSPSEVGKTFFLEYLNRSAIIQRIPSLHLNFEMTEDILTARLDASLIGIKTRDLPERRFERYKRLKKLGKFYSGQEYLMLKSWPMYSKSVDYIDSYIERLNHENFFPRLLTLDYADIITAYKGTGAYDHYWELGNIYAQLKALAQKRKLVIWTASQAIKASFDKPRLSLADVADSVQKVRIADVVVLMCQTSKEQTTGRMRLFLGKNRNQMSRVTIPIKTDYDHGLLYKR